MRQLGGDHSTSNNSTRPLMRQLGGYDHSTSNNSTRPLMRQLGSDHSTSNNAIYTNKAGKLTIIC